MSNYAPQGDYSPRDDPRLLSTTARWPLNFIRGNRKRRTVLAGAVVAGCSAMAPAAGALAQDAEEWIVVGTDAAEATQREFQASFAGQPNAPELEVVESQNGLSIVRIDPEARGLVHSVVHFEFHRCGGYTVHPTRESALRELNNPVYQPGFVHSEGVFPSEPIDQHAIISIALEKIDAANIVETIRSLEALGTRYYQSAGGKQSAALVTQLWGDYTAGREDASVERINHGWEQDSVVATIRGSLRPDEIVVIGGHLDSIIRGDNNNAPGADDDASGIAVVSETLRVLMELGLRPERTI